MGKLSDAFDRQEQEKSMRTSTLRTEKPEGAGTRKGSVRSEQAEGRGEREPATGGRHSGSSEFEKDPAPLTIEDPERTRIRRASLGRKYNPKLVVISSPDSVEAESFKVLRAKIQLARNGSSPRAVMVTSTYPGEGKSFVASNLAASIAFGVDEHVLLVDCDLRKPQVHQYFGYACSQGLSDYLAGRAEIPDLLVKTPIPKLTLLMAGVPPDNPSELVSSNRMEALVDELRDRYKDRYVILDASPTQFTSDSNVLSRHVDGILMVVMAHASPRKDVRNGIQNLAGEKILGVVFNGYDEPMKTYRKYYSGYYGR